METLIALSFGSAATILAVTIINFLLATQPTPVVVPIRVSKN
jgi:hypothetical protein